MQNVIGGLFLAVIGLLLVINPKGVWKVTERWKLAGNAENSTVFVYVAQGVGAVCTIIGALVCFGILK